MGAMRHLASICSSRRTFLALVLATLAMPFPRWASKWLDDDLVIVNGWILRRSDLDSGH